MKKNIYTKKENTKMYKMRGCAKTFKNLHKNKKYSGGKLLSADVNVAYPYTGPTVTNPFLAYTNTNGENPMYPSTGPPSSGFNFLNPLQMQKGGSCGCGLQLGGKKHKSNKKSHKKSHKNNQMKGGNNSIISNNGIPYPNGLVGNPYNSVTNLPGVNNIPGDANYYKNNLYNNGDPQTSMQNINANPPFLGSPVPIRGGKKMNVAKKFNKKMHGGNLSNFLSQDFINLGRQLNYGIGSTYNILNGNSPPNNPMAWQGQLKHISK
jgi:hypothetical protein